MKSNQPQDILVTSIIPLIFFIFPMILLPTSSYDKATYSNLPKQKPVLCDICFLHTKFSIIQYTFFPVKARSLSSLTISANIKSEALYKLFWSKNLSIKKLIGLNELDFHIIQGKIEDEVVLGNSYRITNP